VEGLPVALTPALPVGIDVLAAVTIDERAGSLQEEVTSCDWLVEVAGASPTELDGLVGQALAADSIVVTRRPKGHDVTDDGRATRSAGARVMRRDLPDVRLFPSLGPPGRAPNPHGAPARR